MQKTAYEVRISDWSSDVCSSDLKTVARSVHVWISSPYSSCVVVKRWSVTRRSISPVRILHLQLSQRGEHGQLASAGGDVGALVEGDRHAGETGQLETVGHIALAIPIGRHVAHRSEAHTSELQSLMRI